MKNNRKKVKSIGTGTKLGLVAISGAIIFGLHSYKEMNKDYTIEDVYDAIDASKTAYSSIDDSILESNIIDKDSTSFDENISDLDFDNIKSGIKHSNYSTKGFVLTDNIIVPDKYLNGNSYVYDYSFDNLDLSTVKRMSEDDIISSIHLGSSSKYKVYSNEIDYKEYSDFINNSDIDLAIMSSNYKFITDDVSSLINSYNNLINTIDEDNLDGIKIKILKKDLSVMRDNLLSFYNVDDENNKDEVYTSYSIDNVIKYNIACSKFIEYSDKYIELVNDKVKKRSK